MEFGSIFSVNLVFEQCAFRLDRDLIGIQPKTQRMTFLASTSDFEETLDLPYHLLHRYGQITMQSQLVDSHIYIMKRWIIDYMTQVFYSLI